MTKSVQGNTATKSKFKSVIILKYEASCARGVYAPLNLFGVVNETYHIRINVNNVIYINGNLSNHYIQ